MAGNTGIFGEPCVTHHTAVIYDRGGSRRIYQIIDLNEIEWGRKLDGKSLATLKVTGRSCVEQKRRLAEIEPRRHELVIFRSGERVWEGPVVDIQTTATEFRLDAADITEYLYSRSLSVDWESALDDVDASGVMTDRLQEIIEYELTNSYTITTSAGSVVIPAWESLSPPANVLPFLDVRPGTTLTWADAKAFEMSVGDFLYDRGRSIGVNWTTVGRSLIIWDGDLGQLRALTEADVEGGLTVTSSGSDFYNVAHVVSRSDGGESAPAIGHATTDLSYYGPWERIVGTESGEGSTAPGGAALDSQARRALSGNYPVPLEISTSGSLIPGVGIGINQLVAGVNIPVKAYKNIRPVSQMQRLEQLKVQEGVDGEKISVTLESVGDVEAL